MKIYPLHIVTIQNPDMLTEKQVKRVVKFADELLQTVGVKLKVLSEGVFTNLTPSPYNEPFQMSGAYRNAYQKEYPEAAKQNTHIFIPPIIVGRYKFFGGVGGCVCCEKGNRVSCSSAFLSETVSSPKVVDKLFSCGVIMAHEVGHVIGLSHVKEPLNIMSDYVNMIGGHRGLKFLKGSKKLIQACLKNG